MQHTFPILRVTIVGPMPLKVPGSMFVAREREEERWSIEAMFLSELSKLFRSGLLSEDGHCRIAGHKLDKNRDQRHHCPHHQQENRKASQSIKQLVFYG